MHLPAGSTAISFDPTQARHTFSNIGTLSSTSVDNDAHHPLEIVSFFGFRLECQQR
jgi:hypothetical protein